MRAYLTDRGEVLFPHSFRTPEGAIVETYRLEPKGSPDALPWEEDARPLPPVLQPLAESLRQAKQPH